MLKTPLQKRPAGIGILITYAVFVSLLLIFLDVYSILTGIASTLSLLTLNIFAGIAIIFFAFQTNQGKNKARKIFLTLIFFQGFIGVIYVLSGFFSGSFLPGQEGLAYSRLLIYLLFPVSCLWFFSQSIVLNYYQANHAGFVLTTTLLENDPEFSDGINTILQYLRNNYKVFPFELLRSVNFNLICARFNHWLDEISTLEEIPSGTRALWFGLLQGNEKEAQEGCRLSINACKSGPEEDASGWPYTENNWPSRPCAPADLFAEIEEIIQNYTGPDVHQELEHLILGSLLLLLVRQIKTEFKQKALQNNQCVYLGCGFYGGDIYLAGKYLRKD